MKEIKHIVLILFIATLLSCCLNEQNQNVHEKKDSLKLIFNSKLRHKKEIVNFDSFPSVMYGNLNFPDIVRIQAIDSNQTNYLSSTISYYLYGLGEESLFSQKIKLPTYRLVIIPTFMHPFVIKLVKGEKTKFYYKKTDGISGYYVGGLDTYIEKMVDDSVWNNFNNLVTQQNLFNASIIDLHRFGKDGTDAVLEYCDSIQYEYKYIRPPQNEDVYKYLINLIKTDADLRCKDE
jgi:hypothetical protein